MNRSAVVMERQCDFGELKLNFKILFRRISGFKGLNN
jgi:hypothetical protein